MSGCPSRARAAALLSLFALLLAAPAAAVDLTWFGGNGQAGVAGNWAPAQVPTSADRLLFNTPGPYTVQFGPLAPRSLDHVVTASQVTHALLGAHTIERDLTVAESIGDTASLRVEGGRLVVWDDVRLAVNSVASGRLRIAGDGELFGPSVGPGQGLSCGINGTGRVEVIEGGRLRWGGTATIGTGVGDGDLLVDGYQSAPAFRRSSMRGDSAAAFSNASGTVTVSNGALLSWSADVSLGSEAGRTSRVTVEGASSEDSARFEVFGNVRLGNNLNAGAAGSATIHVGDGGAVVVSGTTTVGDPDGGSGTLEVRAGGLFETGSLVKDGAMGLDFTGGTIRVRNGALDVSQLLLAGAADGPVFELRGASGFLGSIAVSDALVVGLSGTASLDLSEGASLSVSSGRARLGVGPGGDGRLRIRSDATLAVLDPLLAGVAGGAGVVVEEGGFLDVGGLELAALSGASADLRVDGAQSLARVTGPLAVGGTAASAGGTAEVVLTGNGRLLLAGTGPSGTIWPGGLLHVDASRLYPDDSVHVHGELRLDAATVAGGAFVVHPGGLIEGDGDVDSAIRTAPDATAIVRAGGPLSLGSDGVPGAYQLHGLLEVGGEVVTLRGSGVNRMGTVTIAGGELHVSGTNRLDAGHTLTGTGLVSGNVYNYGSIVATTAAGLGFDGLIVGQGAGLSGTRFRFLENGGFTGDGAIPSIIVAEAGARITASDSLALGRADASKAVTLDGTLRVLGHIVSLLTADSVLVAGEIQLGGGRVELSPLRVLGLTPGSTLGGSGGVTGVVRVAGAVSPGDSAGRIEMLSSTVQFTSAGRYVADLGDHGAGEWDTLDVSGALSLLGTLELRTRPGFAAVPGDSFLVVRCGSRTGTFTEVTLDGAPAAGLVAVHYAADGVWVEVLGAPVAVPAIPAAHAGLRFAALGSPGVHVAFELHLPEPAEVEMRAVDVAGRLVSRLHDGPLAAGRHRIALPSGAAPPGVVFARATISTPRGRIERVARAVRLR
jgi:hypothetical protein